MKRIFPRQPFHFQQRWVMGYRLNFGWKDLFQFTSNHHLHHFVMAYRPRGKRGHIAAIAKNRDGIRDFFHLLHAMRDEDHRTVLSVQPFHNVKNRLHLLHGECGSSLVQNQHLWIAGNGFSNFN